VEAFRILCDRGLKGWRLVLAGGLEKEWEGATSYVDDLKRRAEGYPIDMRMDIPGPELRDLFETAAVFWHAKGYGVDPDVNPEHLEHFGIVVVEAMAAGCVPLVFAGGGQQEIVRHGIDGFHWRDPHELADRTWDLIHAAERYAEMPTATVDRAAAFNKQAFINRFREALGELLPSSYPREPATGMRKTAIK
jgi:glycosyltransferase involved in cell wall biosynthesis